MRKQAEITHAICILRQKGDDASLVQVGILEDKRTEAWVFDNFVKNVSEEHKNENLFFAARDAARYLAGRIELEELLPGIITESIESEENHDSSKMTYVDSDLILRLIEQVNRLENKIDNLLKEPDYKTRLNKADVNITDFVNQTQACEFIGCSRVTLRD
ncbi:MAG: DNA-binding protein [Bacteroides sp.]|nr:DNA-binding protein [Bacteroides sp.]